MDKESNKDDKENKEERDKLSPKDLKNRNRRDEKIREKLPRDRETKPIIKGYRERVDERNKDREIKQRRYDEKKLYGRRDERESIKEERRTDFKDDRRYEAKEDRRIEEKRGKSYEKMRQEKKKLAETKKQMVDATISNASPKKMREGHDTVQEKENITGSEESAYNDHLKRVRDNECVQNNNTEDRMVADLTQNCRHLVEQVDGIGNADETIY